MAKVKTTTCRLLLETARHDKQGKGPLKHSGRSQWRVRTSAKRVRVKVTCYAVDVDLIYAPNALTIKKLSVTNPTKEILLETSTSVVLLARRAEKTNSKVCCVMYVFESSTENTFTLVTCVVNEIVEKLCVNTAAKIVTMITAKITLEVLALLGDAMIVFDVSD